ncbi:MAG TPA: RDD family protein, partial [Puia sp.]
EDDNMTTIYIKIYLMVIVLDLFLWTAIEYLGQGKTLGKLITGTRAVNEDGSFITFKTALLRSLSRMVPFEPFSAFGDPSYPWHDRWTRTYVIDDKQSRLPA